MAPTSMKWTWKKRLPRKQRELRTSTPSSSTVVREEMLYPRKVRAVNKPKTKKNSNAPAQLPPGEPTETSRAVSVGHTRARRLAAGRTPEHLHALMRCHVFRPPPSNTAAPVQPAGGLFATWDNAPVFILSTFHRYRVPYADVVRMRPKHANRRHWLARLSAANTHTVPHTALSHVGLSFRLIKKKTHFNRSLCASSEIIIMRALRGFILLSGEGCEKSWDF